MGKKTVSGTMLTLLLIGMLILAFDIQPVKASGTIWIRSDGSVDPDTAPISTIDNVTYTFIDNIYDEIAVERSNIIVDGNGYTLQGSGSGCGFALHSINNVTIKRTKIKGFVVGIGVFYYSCYNTISGNNITQNNQYGIVLVEGSFHNTISGNNITNNGFGIWLWWASSYNSIVGNSITNNGFGIWISQMSYKITISGNNITQNNQHGIVLDLCSGSNTISGNNITQNYQYGIWLREDCSDNTISGNSITNNGHGIWLGVVSAFNMISGNSIMNNGYGIALLGYSFSNTISGNSITNNGYGVWLFEYSFSNTISNNNITQNNQCGIWGNWGSFSNTISGNRITNNQCGIRLDRGSLFLPNSNTISGNSITNNWYGILLESSFSNTISGNNITQNNQCGIWLAISNNNSVSENDIIENAEYGIFLEGSSYNTIYHNNFVNNGEQVISFGRTNFWDDGYPSGGNYWSDYSIRYPTVVDDYHGENQNILGSDGVWDSPYFIDAGNKDNYPFVNSWFLDMIPPVADAGPDQIVHEDTPVTFNGEASSDNVGIVSYVWTFTDVTPKTLTGVNPTYTFQTPGIYTVTLNVTDARGNSDTDEVTITVLDVTNPVADAGPDQTIDEDTEVTFDGSGSTDNVGVASHVWTFIDGGVLQTLSGINPTYTFASPSVYTVTLNVSDAAGHWDTDYVVITVLDVTPPATDAGSDQTVDEDTLVTFDGSGSTDNVGIASYTWTFVDVTPQTLTGVNPTYTFQTPGIYMVTLNVTDAAGNWGTDTVIITVLDVTSPVADAGPDQTVDKDTLVTFEGWQSTDNIGITSWTWTFTDVTPQTLTGENVTYTFTTPGIYTVTLEVSDAAGSHATDTVTITVLSLTPEELLQRLMETIESWNLGRELKTV